MAVVDTATTAPALSAEALASEHTSGAAPSVSSGPATTGESSVWSDRWSDWTETDSNATPIGGDIDDQRQTQERLSDGRPILSPATVTPTTADTSNSELNPCEDCNQRHLPRRIVVCVDGTYGTPDGVVGSLEGNATNVYRIAAVSREGPVDDVRGKKWYQIRKYIDGVGADEEDVILRSVAGLSGLGPTGFQRKIREVYWVSQPKK
jgi:hypothetical protein